MIPKSSSSKTPGDFRPIASLRLLYKLFAYLLLGRLENLLDASQPEEQHGFRSDRRIEEHLLTASLVMEKTLAANLPLWILSLDLSKAFDRVSWPALWQALLDQGTSPHLIWILQVLYHEQEGRVRGNWEESRWFKILAGVRQGCVLSARLFCCVLQWAMKAWRSKVEGSGIDLRDGLCHLLDLRFADDILVFSSSGEEIGILLDSLVSELAKVGLVLNATKTVVLTSQAQGPTQIKTPTGLVIKVVPRSSSQKWLGCMLSCSLSGSHALDLEYHLQAASKAFFANKAILTNRKTSLAMRLKYFVAVVSSVACFAAGHRAFYSEDFHNMAVHFRKLSRIVVGPPAGIDWNSPWHEILHQWHERLDAFLSKFNVPTWSTQCLRQYWSFAACSMGLPSDRWLRRVLAWQPVGMRKQGRPRHSWDDKLKAFCDHCDLGDWQEAAKDTQAWKQMSDDFEFFASGHLG